MSVNNQDHFPEIKPNQIYRDIYKKRIDTREVTGTADLRKGYIRNDKLVFDRTEDRDQAFQEGIFFLEIPKELEIKAGQIFADQFYRGQSFPPYGHFRDINSSQFDDPLLGFHQRINQIEQFLLERRFWAHHYPPEISLLGESLTYIAKQIVCSVLEYTEIPNVEWARATGGCAEASGSYHLTFNHYRSELEGVGLSSHKDDGFVTILMTTAAGLEVNRKNRWEAVPIEPSCFIVNFGLSMQILTSKCIHPVAAIMHRVAHQGQDRSSFGHFSSSNCRQDSDQGIYYYLPNIGLERLCSSRKLIEMNDHEIYNGTEMPEENLYAR